MGVGTQKAKRQVGARVCGGVGSGSGSGACAFTRQLLGEDWEEELADGIAGAGRRMRVGRRLRVRREAA